MATANLNDWGGAQTGASVQRRDAENALWRVLEICGSLKLTVGLFALSMVLVFAGTVAQQSLNMVEVKARYFTAWIAMVRVDGIGAPAGIWPDSMAETSISRICACNDVICWRST